MAEVRVIGAQEVLPNDIDFVLVEPTPGGQFRLSGSVAWFDGKKDGGIHIPPLDSFETESEAVEVARQWADARAVPVVHLRAAT